MAYDIMRGELTERNFALGASFRTSTDDVEDRLKSLTADTNNLNTDVTEWWKAHQGDPKASRFVRAWIEWRNTTYSFIRSWKEGGFFKVKLAWNYMDNANQRIAELAEWRKSWELLSGEKATAPGTVAPPPRRDVGSGGGGAWKWLAVAGLGGLGAMFLAKKIGA